ncbi:MAG: FMN-binding protein [Oscillospiraceae bacterium]|jgi:electron transport complex protein RnfG
MTAKEKYNEYIKPFLALFLICLVSAALLGFVNSKTAPVIESAELAREEQVRKEMLPEETSFTEVSIDEVLGSGVDVDSIYKGDSGTGYVITATRAGYGGDVTVTVGINSKGIVVNISASLPDETQGVGSKAGESSYTDMFIGLSGSADEVDTISGATYSSSAVKECVTAALEAFSIVSQDGGEL